MHGYRDVGLWETWEDVVWCIQDYYQIPLARVRSGGWEVKTRRLSHLEDASILPFL